MNLLFDMEFERTAFSDAAYAAAGRALAYAQKFEGDCRALNLLVQTKDAVKVGELSLDDGDAVHAFVRRIHAQALKRHLDTLMSRFGLPDFEVVLDEAREGRNLIAHEVLLGAQHAMGSDRGRQEIIDALVKAVSAVARAHLAVLVLTGLITNEHVPGSEYLRDYVDEVVAWVAEDIDED